MRSNQVTAAGLALICLLFSLLFPAIARSEPPAQASAEAITYGQSILGTLTESNRAAFYFVRAQRGDVIDIVMRRVSGALDPHLDLATSSGGILASNDDDPLAEGTLNAAIRDFTILKTDTYLIQATGYGGTAGSFTLTVTQTPPEALGKTLERALLIDYGLTLHAILTADSPTRYFCFSAEAGDVVTITAEAAKIAPSVALLSSTAAELARAGESSSTGQARIVAFDVPESGVYYLAVGAAATGDDVDGAELSVQISGRAAPRAGQAVEITYGETVSGPITPGSPVEEYLFHGRAGEVVRVLMERAAGDLDPLVTLYDRERKQIAFDDDGAGEQNALIDAFTLPYDGPYIISASRYQRGLGQTSGAYLLRIERIGSGE